ncbi:MAG: DExD/H-box ATP-dependent RNA helicase dhh1 [Sporothrix thermara]
MLEAGLEYGSLMNGEPIVFLKIDWARPAEVQYYVAQPLREVLENDEADYSNAACQVLAFTLLALQANTHNNDEHVAAASTCDKWTDDFAAVLNKIKREEEELAKADGTAAGSSTPKKAKHRRVPSSPELQPPPLKMSKRDPRLMASPGVSDRVSRSHRSGNAWGYTPAAAARLAKGQAKTGAEVKITTMSGAKAATIKQLRHSVTHSQFMDLLRKQLSQSLVKGVVLGYMFLAKGVTGRRVPDLERDQVVYHRLRALRGYHIPGVPRMYFYDIDVRIIRFLLLSHAGPMLRAGDEEAKAHAIGLASRSSYASRSTLGAISPANSPFFLDCGRPIALPIGMGIFDASQRITRSEAK